MTRRSLFATLAAIFLPKPKVLPMEDWTVVIETGPMIEMSQSAWSRIEWERQRDIEFLSGDRW